MQINIQTVSKPVGLVPRPITFNMDNTVSVTVSLVTIDKVSEPDAEGKLVETSQCNPTGQQSYHQLSAEEGLVVLNATPNKGETHAQAIDRLIIELLRAKGSVNL